MMVLYGRHLTWPNFNIVQVSLLTVHLHSTCNKSKQSKPKCRRLMLQSLTRNGANTNPTSL